MYIGIGHEIIFACRRSEEKYDIIVLNLIYHFKISYEFFENYAIIKFKRFHFKLEQLVL